MSKLRVFVTHSDFPESGIKLLQKKFVVEFYPFPSIVPEDYLMERIKGVDALFCTSMDKITEKVINSAGTRLKIISTMSLGYEHIDLEACKKRKIQVTNVANPIYVSIIAEYTLGLLLTVSRRFVEASTALRRGEWTEIWRPDWLVGRGLVNSCVGIVGMGRIGKEVLKRILTFGVSKVLYYDVYHPIVEAESMGAVFASFEDLLKESDFVIVNCNLTEQNKGLFDSKAFSLMKRSAVFINTSRGGVVNQEALIDALENKKIKAAGIDVMYPEPLPLDHKLMYTPNLIITPHIAASEELALEKNSLLTAENIVEVLAGRPPLTPVFNDTHIKN